MNNKIKALIVTMIIGFGIGNCQITTKVIPNQPVQLKNVEYSVVGSSSAEACQQRFLIFFWGLGDEFSFSTDRFYSRTEAAALYQAQTKLSNADALISPKFDYEDNNYIIYAKHCATVTAKGISYK